MLLIYCLRNPDFQGLRKPPKTLKTLKKCLLDEKRAFCKIGGLLPGRRSADPIPVTPFQIKAPCLRQREIEILSPFAINILFSI